MDMPDDIKDWVGFAQSQSSKSSTPSSIYSEVGEPPPWLLKMQEFATRSADEHLGSGDHLDSFVQYLRRPYDPRFPNAESSKNQQREFAVLYDFQTEGPGHVFHSAAELNEFRAATQQNRPESQLLIVRGHPSPEWLNAIANAFEPDIEFLYHHVELFSRRQGDPSWAWPPLSSRLAREPRLRITSLGTVNKPEHRAREEQHVKQLRSKVRQIYQAYLEEMQREAHVRVGTSLLRDIHVHSAETFSFEQDVSIWTKQLNNGWRGVAWIDIGIDDLFQGPQGSSLRTPLGGDPENTIFGSTIFRRATESSNSTRERLPCSRKDALNTPGSITQNAKHLSHQYEQGLDFALARADSFYALSTIFAFSAASESHFLNMMQSVIRDDIHHATVLDKEKRADAALSNLLSNQLVLSEHVRRLDENILAIRNRQVWPKLQSSSPDATAKIDRAGLKVLDDFQGLLRRAKSLATDCDRGIRRIEHLESYAESKRAISQAEGVEKLTRLAFVFVPMSFTCAFFGMNFKEIGQNSLSLWVWFAATVPVVVLSLVFMVTNLRRKMFSFLGMYSEQVEEGDRGLAKEDMC